jgi:hypothetical protein
MSTLRQLIALYCASWLSLTCTSVGAQPAEFSFGVIGQVVSAPNDGSALLQTIMESDADDLAFVVADGFKRVDEPCSDDLFTLRHDLLGNAKNGLILSLAGNDWSECKTSNGRSTAIERLGRIRDMFYVDDFSLGASKIPLIRQSSEPKFRAFAENTRWEVGNILFASLNLPAVNNRYRMEAGRNGEFEDRQIANRDWLHHTFATANFKHKDAIVLICDGDPMPKPVPQRLPDGAQKHDGFADIRQQLTNLAAKFSGKILIIHNSTNTQAAHADEIVWHGNIGELGVGAEWTKVTVKANSTVGFSAVRGASNSGSEAKRNTP